MHSNPSVCIDCRKANKGIACTIEGHRVFSLHYKWRAPKKNNAKAWRMIADGDVWWDKKAVAKATMYYQPLKRCCSCGNYKALSEDGVNLIPHRRIIDEFDPRLPTKYEDCPGRQVK